MQYGEVTIIQRVMRALVFNIIVTNEPCNERTVHSPLTNSEPPILH